MNLQTCPSEGISKNLRTFTVGNSESFTFALELLYFVLFLLLEEVRQRALHMVTAIWVTQKVVLA